MKITHKLIVVGLFSLASLQAQAAFLSPSFGPNSQQSGWDTLTSARIGVASGTNNITGGFPGSAPWTGPVGPNLGDNLGGFSKTSGAGYASSASIYSHNFSGSFSVSAPDNGWDVANVLFQINSADGLGPGFSSGPTLNYNGGAQALLPNYVAQLSATAVTTPFATTQYERAYQWDLSGIGATIQDISISWGATAHMTTYAMQLNASDTFTQVVPEPSTYAMLAGAGVLGMALVRRRFRK